MKFTIAFVAGLMSLAMNAQSPMSNPGIYVYNDGKDTIHLKKFELGRMFNSGSVMLIKSVQIDGSGGNELILFRKGSGITSDHGGTFDISESKNIEKYEIWNPDTKTLLFEAVSFWSYDYDIFRAGQSLNPAFKYQGKGSEKYKYDVIITDSGSVIIDNFCGANDAKPDHVVGTYIYAGGKYKLKT